MKMSRSFQYLMLRYSTIGVVALVAVIFAIINHPAFLTWDNTMDLMRSSSILLVLALGKSVCLAAGGFDLSAGVTASLGGVVTAILLIWFEAPVWMAILVPLIICALIGLCNGLLIMALGIPDILATLGMSFILGGVLLTIGKGGSIHNYMTNPWTGEPTPGIVPASLRFAATGSIGGFPTLALIAIALAVIVHAMLNHTRWGRYFYIVGGNREAARLSGINVKQTKILSYMICSVCAALTGILLLARIGSAQLAAGEPLSLSAIASVFIGYTVLAAGKANVPGTITGVLLASMLVNGLTMAGVQPYSVGFFRGLALLAAVALQSYQATESKWVH